MANAFKNSIAGSIGTTGVKIYQTPAATSTTVIGVGVANVSTNNISVSVMVRDTSADKCVYVVKDSLIIFLYNFIFFSFSVSPIDNIIPCIFLS